MDSGKRSIAIIGSSGGNLRSQGGDEPAALLRTLPARKVSGMDEVGAVAGAVAGILSVNGGVIGGLVGGVLAGIGVYHLMRRTLAWGWPVTTARPRPICRPSLRRSSRPMR